MRHISYQEGITPDPQKWLHIDMPGK